LTAAARRRLLPVALTAAAVILGLTIGLAWQQRSFAIVEAGSLFQSVDGASTELHPGATVNPGTTVWSGERDGGVLRLADRSRVEMRTGSELRLERTNEGVRIHLRKGQVIVSATKRRTGRLYVETKDVTVSVVGTVFLVNAEEEGSHVAVIEGEVRVQLGATTKNLLPGEQLSTSPKLEGISVKEEVGWSREAETHVALLQQSAASLAEPRIAFEEVSIRMRQGVEGGGAGLRGQGGSPPTIDDIPFDPCGSVGPAAPGPGQFTPQLDPRRFAVTRAGLLWLITVAYGLGQRDSSDVSCRNVVALKLLSEGPDWVRSTEFDIEALIPPGTPVYTVRQLEQGEAPDLQKMLQTMLAERFKLVLKRETKEMPVYILSMAPGGAKLTPAKERELTVMSTGAGSFPGSLNYHPPKYDYGTGTIIGHVTGHKVSMDQLAGRLQRVTQRPVINRTGIPGDFDFEVIFAPEQFYATSVARRIAEGKRILSSPSLFKALEDELGLQLEPSRAPVEAFVIERVEKPTQN
jgi:uncharacterized protein (TIGR03435 family)